MTMLAVGIICVIAGATGMFVLLLCWYTIRHVKLLRDSFKELDNRVSMLDRQIIHTGDRSAQDFARLQVAISDLYRPLGERTVEDPLLIETIRSEPRPAVAESAGSNFYTRNVWAQIGGEP